MTADLTNPVFTDETKAREWLEAKRWPNGPVCPHCGVTAERVTRLDGNAARPGLWQCNDCHGQFSVTIGTLYERSHIPLHKWLLATHLLTSSKKGISAHQLHRMLGITYKTAWFMAHRIREGFKDTKAGPLGGEGKTVEMDETYYGPKDRRGPGRKARQGTGNKSKVVSLVQRGGPVRSFKVENADAATVKRIVQENIAKGGALMTDESGIYTGVGGKLEGHFESHGKTMHSAGEYVKKDDPLVHSNTVEGFFSIFKRGMHGVYQHCGEQHLQRYLDEFDFRYSNRAASVLTMRSAPAARSKAATASGSPIGGLVERPRDSQPEAATPPSGVSLKASVSDAQPCRPFPSATCAACRMIGGLPRVRGARLLRRCSPDLRLSWLQVNTAGPDSHRLRPARYPDRCQPNQEPKT
jgi:transposase-like protein